MLYTLLTLLMIRRMKRRRRGHRHPDEFLPKPKYFGLEKCQIHGTTTYEYAEPKN